MKPFATIISVIYRRAIFNNRIIYKIFVCIVKFREGNPMAIKIRIIR